MLDALTRDARNFLFFYVNVLLALQFPTSTIRVIFSHKRNMYYIYQFMWENLFDTGSCKIFIASDMIQMQDGKWVRTKVKYREYNFFRSTISTVCARDSL